MDSNVWETTRRAIAKLGSGSKRRRSPERFQPTTIDGVQVCEGCCCADDIIQGLVRCDFCPRAYHEACDVGGVRVVPSRPTKPSARATANGARANSNQDPAPPMGDADADAADGDGGGGAPRKLTEEELKNQTAFVGVPLRRKGGVAYYGRVRHQGVVYAVGDDIVCCGEGSDDKEEWVATIDDLFVADGKQFLVNLTWFYRLRDLPYTCTRPPSSHPSELFWSEHRDANQPLSCILRRAKVVPYESFSPAPDTYFVQHRLKRNFTGLVKIHDSFFPRKAPEPDDIPDYPPRPAPEPEPEPAHAPLRPPEPIPSPADDVPGEILYKCSVCVAGEGEQPSPGSLLEDEDDKALARAVMQRMSRVRR